MKTIDKSAEPPCLSKARKACRNWEDFHSNCQDCYETVLNLALQDQGNECAYTGLWIGEGTTQRVHIDHFCKREIYPKETFSWDNLFAAVKIADYGADFKDKQVNKGNAKALYRSFWSPLQVNLQAAFHYRQDGVMEPSGSLSDQDKKMAQQTIDMFNLNAADLKERRKGIILLLRNMKGVSEDGLRSVCKTAGFSALVEQELRNRDE